MKILQYKIKNFGCIGLLLLLITHANAQMGVGEPSPGNSTEIVTTAGKIIVDNTGKVGVLVANPKVALDLRSGNNGSVAVGGTTQTATAAGAGALRYVNSPAIGVLGYLEYSDGTNWVSFFPYGKPRIVVMARKTTQNTVVFEGADSGEKTGLMQRRSSYLTNWTEVLDSDSGVSTSNFDPATGEFVAPRNGVYFATFTYALGPQVVESGANVQTEAIWEVRNSSGTIKQRVKTNNGYASNSGTGTQPVGAACTVSVYMQQGDKLRPFSWISTRFGDNDMSTFNTTNNGEYNVLTIVEQ